MKKLIIYLISLITVWVSTTITAQNPDWPLFRGNPGLTGKTEWTLPANPEVLWSFNSGDRTKSSPVISNGVIYFGTDKGSLVAVESNGKLKWKLGAGSPIEAPPLISDNKVIYSTVDGTLRAADKETGKILWSYKTGDQIAGSANEWSSGKRTYILVGSYDFYLHCVDRETGKLMWKVETENYVNGAPAISGSRVIFGGCDGMLRILDPLTGKQLKIVEIGVYMAASPATIFPEAYIGDYDGNFYRVDIDKGEIKWYKTIGDGGSPVMSVPALSGNSVVTGSGDNSIYCFNIADGSLRWSYRTNGSIEGSPVISGNNVLVGSTDGYVYLLSLSDGSRKWSFNCGSSIISSPAVTQDRFYILTQDGRLIAFGKKNNKQ